MVAARDDDAAEVERAAVASVELDERGVARVPIGRRLGAGLVVTADQRPVEELVRMQERRDDSTHLVAVEKGLDHRALRAHLVDPHDARQPGRRLAELEALEPRRRLPSVARAR